MIVPVRHSDGKDYDPFVLWQSTLEQESRRLSVKVYSLKYSILCSLWNQRMPRITSADERRAKLLCKIELKICHLKIAKLLRDECHVPQWKALKLARRWQTDSGFRIARHLPRWSLAAHTQGAFR